jgi:Pvc16 N-terminal domain
MGETATGETLWQADGVEDMANIAAIRSVGTSLAEYLDRSYRAAAFPLDVNKPSCAFNVVSSGRIQEEDDPSEGTASVLIFLYHVSIDPHLRNSGRLTTPDMPTPPLSITLHYLFTFWSNSAEVEHLVLAWTMMELQATSLLDATILSREARWSAEDVVQLIPEELSNEDMMRIWDTLRPDYRLSLGYVARVVRIEPEPDEQQPPVIAARFNYAVPAGSP